MFGFDEDWPLGGPSQSTFRPNIDMMHSKKWNDS